MFNNLLKKVLVCFCASVVCFSSLVGRIEANETRYESGNFVFYFENINSDAYEDRVAISDMVEEIYKEVSDRLDIRFDGKIAFYLMEPWFDNWGHGYGRASMNKSGEVSLYYIYYPLATWRKDKEYSFMLPYLKDVQDEMRCRIEEGLVTALFMIKYLLPQKEPRVFNEVVYGMTACFCERDIHSGVRWMADDIMINERYPMNIILRGESLMSYDNTWDIVSSKFISFGGYIVEKYGFEKFEKLLSSADSKNVDEFILKLYGKNTDALEKEWLEWLRGKVGVYNKPNIDLRRRIYARLCEFYTMAARVQDISVKRSLLDAVASLQAALSTHQEENEGLIAAVQQILDKRLKDLVKRNELIRVDFCFESKNPSDSVFLAGDFNNWNPSHPLYQLKNMYDKSAVKLVTLYLPKGKYQYKFVLNGNRWLTDTSADGLAPDGLGGHNSVIMIDGKNENRVVKMREDKER